MTFYGLRNKHTKIPLGWGQESDYDEDDGSHICFHLDDYKDPGRVWLVRTRELAERVLTRDEDIEWYNAEYDTPSLGHLLQRDYEVFEVEI